ncbi:MAG: ABC transporter ATP-binding protein [Lachnospiraceae bacterium]|nr:ABC transporter ATP-binding protein [Lachnospiraceae bacterium]
MRKNTLKFVFHYLKSRVFLVIASVLLAFISAIGTLLLPILTGRILDHIVDEGAVNFEAILPLISAGAIIIAVVSLSQFLMSLCNNRITTKVVQLMRQDAIRKIQRLPVSYMDTHPVGDLVSRIITDVDTFSDGLLLGFTQLFTGVVTILGTLGFMFAVDPMIALVVVLVTPLSFFVAGFISKKTYHLFAVQSKVRGEQTAFVEEMVGNQKVVRAFGHEKENEEKFIQINNELQKTSLKALFFSSLTNPSTRFVNAIVYAGVAICGALAVMNPDRVFSVGDLSCFLAYATQYTKPFNEISEVITEFQNALACAGRLYDFMQEKEEEDVVAKETRDDKNAAADKTRDDKNAAGQSKVLGAVDIENVCFSYVPNKKLIENFSLNVRPGQRIAIVGPTGCGKTTLINLLMRFYDVNSGNIYLDGKEIRSMSRMQLRQSIGMVLQETWLRAGTIRDNIAMGKPDATDEEIIRAAKQAHAHSFIERLQNGYQTIVKEEGGNLSNGQKQLLCIARVMLINPPMLILDEATSSIDTRTEMKVQDAFLHLMENKTSFIVAHRLSTIRSADVILVMKDGNIIEQGSHEELLQKKGFYYNLYQSQWA